MIMSSIIAHEAIRVSSGCGLRFVRRARSRGTARSQSTICAHLGLTTCYLQVLDSRADGAVYCLLCNNDKI
eukprot:scaffold173893_cov24-Tisochrysis_lutea.AAC.6